ncbi:MAG TPA: HAMP domain-containing sensor histidine kinase [Bryobacteraceae bacterium]|jgi:signal transduction histidine kinase|nr:HAMP domain-containing sensor histidine kinase [Bryobacteraceae bacterium]
MTGTVAAAFAILTILEYDRARTIGEASRSRLEAVLNTALTGARDDFDGSLRRLSDGLPAPRDGESPAQYAGRAASWYSAAAYRDLIARLLLATPSSSTLLELAPAPGRPVESALDMARLPEIGTASGGVPVVWIARDGTNRLVRITSSASPGGPARYLLIELKPGVLEGRIVPAIIRERFGEDSASEFRATLIRTDRGMLRSGTHYDGRIVLFRTPSATGFNFREIAATHRAGSLDAAERVVRRRWLAIYLAISLALAAGVTPILLSTLRIRRILRLQMEFVASVSHELRTPLSVIGSAADNLAEGVVRSDRGVREYGALIRSECRRLSGLVEQTLRFAAGKADYRSRNMQFIQVSGIVDRTLAEAAAVIGASGFTVEKQIDPDLPMIRVDPTVLSECLGNLVSNALKYGGEKRWFAIRAAAVETGRGSGVRITVQDHGLGIAAEELPHIFEPFYRGHAAQATAIRGTGLGLSLAQEAARSMGARITVESAPGEGTAFTIHIPAAYMNSTTVPVEAMVEF